MTHRPHRLTKRDANQGDIAAELRKSGFEVLDVSALGGKVLDLLVIGWDLTQNRKVMRMVEVKQPGEASSLTYDEGEMVCRWPGVCFVAETAEDVLMVYGMLVL